MKLATYQMQEAFASKDWQAALSILEKHFNIRLPYSFSEDNASLFCEPEQRQYIGAQMTSEYGDAIDYCWDGSRFIKVYSANYWPKIRIWYNP